MVNGGGDIFEVPTDAAAVTAESPPAESSAVLGKNEETEELADVPPETFPDVVVMEGALIEEESGFDVLGGRVETERDVVHRHMPDWIAHPHLVEADIRTHSKPIAEFSLPDVILKNLRSMGISRLFPVQSHVIPHLTRATAVARATGVAPNDLLVCAPTGCGKTLCYVVPVSCALLDFHVRKASNITELIAQINDVVGGDDVIKCFTTATTKDKSRINFYHLLECGCAIKSFYRYFCVLVSLNIN